MAQCLMSLKLTTSWALIINNGLPRSQPGNPLHGVTLEKMLIELVDSLGWDAMGVALPIRCFTHEPSITSSLKFLRRTPWARVKVEELYLQRQ